MHRSRPVGRLALALVASAVLAPISPAQQSPRPDRDPHPEVRRLEFVGVSRQVDLDALKASIATEATRCTSFLLTPICRFTRYRGFEERHYLDRRELKRDVLRIRVFYYEHGFREAQVDTVVTPLTDKSVAVRFEIVEGPPTVVTDVSVTVDSAILSARRIRALSTLEKGEPLDLFQLDTMRVNFQNALWDLGYADALIDSSTVVDPVSRTARVQFRIAANHRTTVGDIVIRGTEQVAPRTVLNSLTFRSGDLFKRSAVIESQRNLYESNLFRLAKIDVPQTFDSVKTVSVLLREAPLHQARTSLGFNTVDFIQTEARFTHYNLLGGARRLDVTATLGNLGAAALNGRGLFRRQRPDTTITGDASDFLQPTYQVSATLQQPAWLQRPRNALGVGLFAQRRSVPAVVIDRGYGGNLTYTRALALRAPASLTYRFEVTRVEAGGPYFCVNFGVCDTTSVAALRSHQRLSPLLLTALVDRTDQPLAPTRGYSARADLEYASRLTISDYRYYRAYGEGATHSRLGQRSAVLATHVRLGFVRPLAGGGTIGEAVLHPRKRFYAGGSQSVRGYGENQLGPRVLTLPNFYLAHSRTITGAACDIRSTAIRLCDPNDARDTSRTDGMYQRVGSDKFTPRPLGGTSLLEGSVEYRFPLPILSSLRGAVFLDGAAVGERLLDPLGAGVRTLADLVSGSGAITPGFGIRYYSPVGPIRMDLGFNPSVVENLAVITEIERNGKRELIPLEKPFRYTSATGGSPISRLLNRFTLHLSIGEAY